MNGQRNRRDPRGKKIRKAGKLFQNAWLWEVYIRAPAASLPFLDMFIITARARAQDIRKKPLGGAAFQVIFFMVKGGFPRFRI